MNKLDERRLTGFNVVCKHAGAVVDVALDPHEDAEQVIRLWRQQAERILNAVGWSEQKTYAHRFKAGVSLVITAPIDVLYAAVEIAQWIYQQVELIVDGDDALPDIQEVVAGFKDLIAEEQNTALLALECKARLHRQIFLWDDDEASVGLGKGSMTWRVQELPEAIDWQHIHSIPVGLVTGTNGKTTSARLAQHILRTAGLTVGISSTDWIAVNDDIIDRGDYSGPGGARAVLRQQAIDAAILETARGGLLRRGLGTPRADAALITNISEDHLGDFGSQNLQELVDLKWIVTKALDQQSHVILNADDDLLVNKSDELDVPTVWFSLDPTNPLMASHTNGGGFAITMRDNSIQRFDGSTWHVISMINDIPITLGGTAKHNIANALGAVGLCHVLGIDDQNIATGLQTFELQNNPGRCNFFNIEGREVLLDFAHNPSAMNAIFEMASHHSATSRRLCFGQAGDRTDQQIHELAKKAWGIGLDHVYISELSDYYRGREPNEVYQLLRGGLISSGAKEQQITHCQTEMEALKRALRESTSGDLIIMLALADARNILNELQKLSN